MNAGRRVVIVEENSSVPEDIRVWYEATSLRDAGWNVRVICPAGTGAHAGHGTVVVHREPENLDGIRVYRYRLTFAERGIGSFVREYLTAFSATARLAWRAWRDEHFEILHFCNPPDIFFPIGLFFRLLGVKVVFDHHDTFPETVQWRFHGAAGKLLYGFARVTEFLSWRCANIVLSTNESYRAIALKRGRMNPDRVFVVRNGPKLSEFVPVETRPELKQGLPHMACYLGVMGHEAGILDLLAAIRYIVHDLNRRDIFFALLGDGAMRPQALEKVKAWGLEPYVGLPGLIRDRHLLRQYLCTADIGLAPIPVTPHTQYSTPVKLGEYMSMARPTVAFDLIETRNTGQDAAVYVPPGEIEAFGRAIVELVDDPERCRRMGESGQRRVYEQLAWEHQVKKLFLAYDTALGRAADARSEPAACQLYTVPGVSEGSADDLPRPLVQRVRLALRRRVSYQQRRKLKMRLRKLLDRLEGLRGKADIPAPASDPVVEPALQAGDWVRVRSQEEIGASLDRWDQYKGCAFMPEMTPYCGTTQRVLKPVRKFLDERDYHVKKTSGVVLLEGVICPGTETFGPCDRSCFFFWRQEWLEKIEEP